MSFIAMPESCQKHQTAPKRLSVYIVKREQPLPIRYSLSADEINFIETAIKPVGLRSSYDN